MATGGVERGPATVRTGSGGLVDDLPLFLHTVAADGDAFEQGLHYGQGERIPLERDGVVAKTRALEDGGVHGRESSRVARRPMALPPSRVLSSHPIRHGSLRSMEISITYCGV